MLQVCLAAGADTANLNAAGVLSRRPCDKTWQAGQAMLLNKPTLLITRQSNLGLDVVAVAVDGQRQSHSRT